MMLSRQASIRTRLVLLILATVTIVLSAALATWVHRDSRALVKHAEEDLRSLLAAQDFDFIRLLVFRTADAAADMVSRLQQFHEVMNLLVVDLDGNVILSYARADVAPLASIPTGSAPKGFLHVHHDVTRDGQRYGRTFVRAKSDAFADELPAVLETFQFLAPALLALTLLLAWIFQRFFSAPVLRLTEFIKNVSAHNDYDSRLTADYGAEFGVLYNGFNQMLDQIQDANARVDQKRERLNQVLDSIPDAILLTDSEFNITYANQTARQLFDLPDPTDATPPVSLGRYIRIGDSAGDPIDPRALRSRHGATFDVLVLASGQKLTCDITVSALQQKDQSDIASVVSIRDITERKRAEAQAASAEQAKIAADAANQAKSTFLAHMSHEIRTPLTAIIGFTEDLRDDTSIPPQQQRETLNTVLRSSQHLLQIINDILDFSKIESGKLPIEKDITPLMKALAEVIGIVDGLARQKSVAFAVNFATPIPREIPTDGLRLKQILMNLLGNAVKFTDQGSVTLSVECDPQRQRIRFLVQDSGIGMSDEQLARIFDPFTQADNTISRRYGGTGLGLSLSQRLAQLLGGKIEAKSELGGGSQFCLELPTGSLEKAQWVEQPQALQHSVRNASESASPRLRGRIAVAEDTPELLNLIARLLKRAGLDVTTTENGLELLEAVEHGEFDLIITDMRMPVMDGVTAVTRLRAAGKRMPIIALTANATDDDRNSCLRAGCDDVVTKPIDRSVLFGVLQRHLNGSPETSQPTDGAIYSSLLEDEPEMADLVEQYVEMLPQKLEIMQNAAKQGQWKTVEAEAHKLKGTGTEFGFPMITEIAGGLESLLRNNQAEQAGPVLDRLAAVIKRVEFGPGVTTSD